MDCETTCAEPLRDERLTECWLANDLLPLKESSAPFKELFIEPNESELIELEEARSE